METSTPELLVVAGPLAGRRFEVPPAGLRLGRSSSCEIAVADPALSRNHCLFERRGEELWVTDLASANGTLVNDVELGAEPVRLAVGDVIMAGSSELKIVAPSAAAEGQAGEPPPAFDLGLGAAADAERPAEEGEAAQPVKPNLMRLVMWAVAGLAVLGAVYMIVGTPPPEETPPAPVTVTTAEPANAGKLVAVSFEKVQASSGGIYRFALECSAAGVLAATIDDVPVANRHVEKSVKLTAARLERLDALLKDAALYALAPSYTGTPLHPGEARSLRLKIVRTGGVFQTAVENELEPEVLRDVREQLEAFAKNELGIWGIDKSVDELKAMSREARRNGDAKWEERDVQHGNLAQAIAAYGEAVMLLETVNPKPDGYDALTARIREAKAELDRRYREQCFRADKAINLKDWSTALAELRILCDLVPDDRDPRHVEANAKLLDVEARQKEKKK